MYPINNTSLNGLLNSKVKNVKTGTIYKVFYFTTNNKWQINRIGLQPISGDSQPVSNENAIELNAMDKDFGDLILL
jgi:hypothetical protein